jgi:signal peptidase I
MTPTPPEAAPSASRRGLGCLLEIVETLVLTAVLFWVIQNFVAQPFQVKQHSMEHTIEDSQFVLVDRLTPHFDQYHRGDIIVFTPPANVESPGGDPYIKRVIGVAGDTVTLKGGKVFVNGTLLVEPYVYAVGDVAQPTVPDPPDGGKTSWKVEPGELFVMGDHRMQSTDSRNFGPIAIAKVIGRAWLRYWPADSFGVLPTSAHPELATPSPGASASPSGGAKPSAKPTTKPKPKPSRTPRP